MEKTATNKRNWLWGSIATPISAWNADNDDDDDDDNLKVTFDFVNRACVPPKRVLAVFINLLKTFSQQLVHEYMPMGMFLPISL